MSEKIRPEWLAKRVEDGYYEEDGGFVGEWFLQDLNALIKSACAEEVKWKVKEMLSEPFLLAHFIKGKREGFSSGYARCREDAAKEAESLNESVVAFHIRKLTPPEEAK